MSKLGFSGYGFSVDDDTADVGAGGASQLQLTVTETGGLNNTNPWTIQAPYGPVKNVSLPYSGPASRDQRGHPLQRHRQRQQYHTDQDHHAVPAQPLRRSHRADRPGRRRPRGQWHLQDRQCLAVDVRPVRCRHGHDAGFPDAALTPTGGRWSYPLHPYVDSGADLTKVFYRVTGDDALGTFQGTLVSVNGVDA